MNIAIVGFGSEGRSAYEYYKDQGEITICDKNEDVALPEDVQPQLGEQYLEGLESFDLVVVSPGVPTYLLPDDITMTTVTAEFFSQCKATIIGVTGTKGKGTTSTLIAKMLETAGERVHLGGNIGVPALDLLADIEDDDIVVLELSSFQLNDVHQSPNIAVVLPVTSDHLDHHKTRDDYVEAKANIARFQSKDDVIVFHSRDESANYIAEKSKGIKQPYLSTAFAHLREDTLFYGEEEIMKIDEIGLVGPHNYENACAAVTVAWNITQDKGVLRTALRDFKGLEHRLEYVAEVDGVEYYNDSFSSAEIASVAAINSFTRPIVLILGGYDKGADYETLGNKVANSTVRDVILIGANRNKIDAALRNAGFKNIHATSAKTMKEVVDLTAELANEGDVAVLSPASASFDMFENFKERGKKFKEAVRKLQ